MIVNIMFAEAVLQDQALHRQKQVVITMSTCVNLAGTRLARVVAVQLGRGVPSTTEMRSSSCGAAHAGLRQTGACGARNARS